jgi:hypothetical protein
VSATDPLSTAWHALERTGCRPSGDQHNAAAHCPAHDDRTASLSLGVGADGRALLHCHAGCEVEPIVAALGLTWGDLFPPGHHRARRRRLPEARRQTSPATSARS